MCPCPKLVIVLVFAGLLAGCAATVMRAGKPGATRATDLGQVFVDANDMTLYTHDPDEPGKSVCSGICAIVWPPVTASANATPRGRFTIVTREDGTRQWAYDDRPLYGYIRDSQPGDTTGDGVDKVWHVARP